MDNSIQPVICFSLYGNIPKYTVGTLRNIEIAKSIYPNWHVFVYYDNTVPQNYIELYNQYDHVTTVDMSGQGIPGMFWRFLNEADIFISRDVDSRLSLREKYCVDEWLFSGKRFHVLRDHPAHNIITVPGGMWGLRRIWPGQNINIERTVKTWLEHNAGTDAYGQDQIFLKGLYGYHYQNKDILIHDSIGTYGDDSEPFPSRLDREYHFVGEVWDENDVRRSDHIRDWVENASKERFRSH